MKLRILIQTHTLNEFKTIYQAMKFYPFLDGTQCTLRCFEKDEHDSISEYIAEQSINTSSTLRYTFDEFDESHDVYVYTTEACYQFINPHKDHYSLLFIGQRYSFFSSYKEAGGIYLPDWLDLKGFNIGYIGVKPRDITIDQLGLSRYKDLKTYHLKAQAKDIIIGNHDELCDTLYQQNPSSFLVFVPSNPKPAILLGMDKTPLEFKHMQVLSQFKCIENSYSPNGTLTPDLTQNSFYSYSLFAKYYDKYMAHVDYDSWVKSIKTWYKKHTTIYLENILEIACGTASVASRLVKEGYVVHASDKSPQMLIIANQKHPRPFLYQADMLQPYPYKDYDLILCLFDSINYLRETEELRLCLINAYNGLKNGGLFIFDISTLANSHDNFHDIVNYTRSLDGNIVHEAYYDEESETQHSKLIFYQRRGAIFVKYEEEHRQRVYRSHEIVRIIESSKFHLVGLYSGQNRYNYINQRNTDLDKLHHRLFYVLKKVEL